MASNNTSEVQVNNNDRKSRELAALQALANKGDEDAIFILSQGTGNEPDALNIAGTWPKLAKYITAFSPNGRATTGTDLEVKIDLTCDICLIRHIKLPPWVRGPESAADRNSEGLCVLPCGHYFGYDCMSIWCKLHGECPKCRYELIHLDCEHRIEIKMMEENPMIPSVERYAAIEDVPFSRLHILKPDHHQVFQDVSNWDPSIADQDHDYGITPECYECTVIADEPIDSDVTSPEFLARELAWWDYLKW
ncbi:hypothetical protein F5Y03DRAFT_222726 [Xylaria venustula]|nr:hypothetical protein F5Y03DRAFT_222726 [Xylaria venustula]